MNTKQEFKALIERARQAGMAAGTGFRPTPMVVQQRAKPFNDSSPVVYEEVVENGPCGFAWINIKPGTSSFARWLVKENIARSAYEGGVSIWVHDFGQSMQKKEAYAHAFANVLREAGFKAYPGSRMD